MNNVSLSVGLQFLLRVVLFLVVMPLSMGQAAPEQPQSHRSPMRDARPHNLEYFEFPGADASGVIERINNIVNLTVVSTDRNDLRAEYNAGFVQGKLQGKTIVSARDNSWDNVYLTTPPPQTFPAQLPPTDSELKRAADLLNPNYDAFLEYLDDEETDQDVAHRLTRLLFRLLGIYHGVDRDEPDNSIDFAGDWLPDRDYFEESEFELGYDTDDLTFLDVYFVNAFVDLMDVIASETDADAVGAEYHPDKCSAFLKRSRGEVILTHNSWMGYLSQSMVQTLAVNGDLWTVNAMAPGVIGSATDFGYNNKGIMFNETTHRMSRIKTKPLGIWTFWRAALAEQFSASIDEFFDAISLDNSGTYLNGYMLVDAKTNETGLVEMSYRCFIYYRSSGASYTVSTKSLDERPCSAEYDQEMVTADYLMGINYPASLQVREDLQSTDNRPARREQFKKLLPKVNNAATARRVITYIDQKNPLSIFGRWDLGYGETDYPKQVPDGAVDAKVGTTAMVRSFMGLNGTLDADSLNTGFWMLYGTAYVKGKPFIWSDSLWSEQTLRDVPDRLDGRFTLMSLYLK
jgi:hypothetical protein